jgi:hypothetical protein
MFSVPPDLGVPPPFTACHPATVGPLELPLLDDVELLLHAAARSARAARAAPAAYARERFRIGTLLLLRVVGESSFRGCGCRGLVAPRQKAPHGVYRIMLGVVTLAVNRLPAEML